jgi:hypothetical protein
MIFLSLPDDAEHMLDKIIPEITLTYDLASLM